MLSPKVSVIWLAVGLIALPLSSAVAGPGGGPGNPVLCNADSNGTKDVAFGGNATTGSHRFNTISDGTTLAQSFFSNGGGVYLLVGCEVNAGAASLVEQGVSGAAANAARVGTLNATGSAVTNTVFVGLGGATFEYVGSADIDGDGGAEYIFQGKTGTSSFGVGRVNFVSGTNAGTAVFIPLGGGIFNFAGAADADNDDDDDLFFLASDGTVRVDTSNGTAISTGAAFFSIGGDFNIIDIRDADNDGNADLLLDTKVSASQPTTQVRKLSGGLPTGAQTFIPNAGGTLPAVFFADTDGDGLADVIQNGGTTTRINANSGSLAFAAGVDISNGGNSPVGAGDFDADGDQDIIGQNSFQAQITLLDGTAKEGVQPAAIPNAGGNFSVTP